MTESPSAVSIVTDLPLVGTVPAKLTMPAAGASTGVPGSPPMSIPRCAPPAYGCAGSNANPCSTGPLTGHVHAAAEGTQRASITTSRANRRTGITTSVV